MIFNYGVVMLRDERSSPAQLALLRDMPGVRRLRIAEQLYWPGFRIDKYFEIGRALRVNAGGRRQRTNGEDLVGLNPDGFQQSFRVFLREPSLRKISRLVIPNLRNE